MTPNALHLIMLGAISVILLLVDRAATAFDQGQTSVLKYSVDMKISSRFARTHIHMEVANDRDDCTALAGYTFQLPINARVTGMTMTTVPSNCEKNGVVKEIKQAEREFVQQAVQGQSAALLKAYDATQYGLQVSIPPSGFTTIDIHLEELLHRYRGKVDFQVPLYVDMEIDELILDIAIQEPRSGVARFDIVRDYADIPNTAESLLDSIQVVPSSTNRPVATAHLEAFGVLPGIGGGRTMPLPRLLKGFYDPGPLPQDGLLLSDPFGKCFVHLFNPDSLLATTGSLPRNIVFAIDVSGSMNRRKLNDAKAAFSAIINRLTDDDYFIVQTFSSQAVKSKFGPFLATSDVKMLAIDWVNGLDSGGGTNLEGAYVEGIRQVESMQTESVLAGGSPTSFVPVVMVLTDGQPTVGEENPSSISWNVRHMNNANELNAKIYGLAFGDGADFALLSGISLQNGGRAVRIFEGYGDSVTQMENFFEGELGTIVMSNVHVTFDGPVDSLTQNIFPVFAAGSELISRARVLEGEGMVVTATTTTATTVQGSMEWNTGLSSTEQLQVLPGDRNECIQSFAHQKISELLQFRDACLTLGSFEMMDYYPTFSLYNGMVPATVQRNEEKNICTAVEEEALQLALEAAVVWPGLTAMVTIDSADCEEATVGIPLCFDGDGDEQLEEAEEEDDERYVDRGGPPQTGDSSGWGTGAPTSSATIGGTCCSTVLPSATPGPTDWSTYNVTYAPSDDDMADAVSNSSTDSPRPDASNMGNATTAGPPPTLPEPVENVGTIPTDLGGYPQVTPIPGSQIGSLGPTDQVFAQQYGESYSASGGGIMGVQEYGDSGPNAPNAMAPEGSSDSGGMMTAKPGMIVLTAIVVVGHWLLVVF